MAGIRRIVVGLKYHEKSDAVKLAKFLDCIVNHFHPNDVGLGLGLSVQVSCKLENNILLLYPPSQHDKQLATQQSDKRYTREVDFGSVTLQHSPECPVWLLSQAPDMTMPATVPDPGVHVGVSLVVESLDERILMTQRPDHMRTFPRAWVPPGGHIEFDETLAEGGLRELEEETGLRLDEHNSHTRLLCLWESVYPVFLGMGNPKSHHVVVYLHTKVKETWEELQAKIKLDPEEVQGWVWLSQSNVQNISFNRKKKELINKYTIDPKNGRISSTPIDLLQMFPSSLWGDRKIYSGSQMALNAWLDLLEQRLVHPSKM